MTTKPPTTRYGATQEDLGALLGAWGEPQYRVAQLFDGLWTQRTPLEDLSSLPKKLARASRRRRAGSRVKRSAGGLLWFLRLGV